MNQAEVGVMEKKSLFARRRLVWVIILALILLIILGSYLVWKKNTQPPLINNVSAPTNNAISEAQLREANKSISAKNYTEAAQAYAISATLASSAKDYDKAMSILQTAIKKIPDDQVPYYIYGDIYGVAVKQNNKSLEISSLKKAITKAEQPNSGAPDGLVDLYKDKLSKLQ